MYNAGLLQIKISVARNDDRYQQYILNNESVFILIMIQNLFQG